MTPQAPTPLASSPIAGGFDAAVIERAIATGALIETASGLIPSGAGHDDTHCESHGETRGETNPAADGALPELLEHERSILSAVLAGTSDNRELWGLFRRRIGLRFNEAVPASLWTSAEHRAVADEIDATFRAERDIQAIQAESLRQSLRQRAIDGRFQGSLQALDTAIAELLRWAAGSSGHDFELACTLFQSAKARQLFYPELRRLLAREQRDICIDGELEACRTALNAAVSITSGRFHSRRSCGTAADAAAESLALAQMPLSERPQPISTGIPSFDLDMRGGIIPGQGEGTYVIAARSGVGKTTVAVAAAMGLAMGGAGVLFFSCELSRRAIGARLLAHYSRRAHGLYTPQYSANDLEGRGNAIAGADLERLQRWSADFAQGRSPTGDAMGPLLYESQFGATVEQFAAVVEDAKAACPQLSAVFLDHFHAMGSSPGFGPNTTAELSARAMQIKALAGRCEVDVFVVAQLNRGAYNNPTGPDVSHLAGTSELERYASAVWLIDRPKTDGYSAPAAGLLEVHHGKFRHGQLASDDLSKTAIRLDRAHCYLEADEARRVFIGSSLYPGVEAL